MAAFIAIQEVNVIKWFTALKISNNPNWNFFNS